MADYRDYSGSEYEVVDTVTATIVFELEIKKYSSMLVKTFMEPAKMTDFFVVVNKATQRNVLGKTFRNIGDAKEALRKYYLRTSSNIYSME